MGVYESRGQIDKAMKDLLARWQDVRALWNDDRAEAIEKEFLEQLEIDLRAADNAMDQMAITLQKVHQECGS